MKPWIKKLSRSFLLRIAIAPLARDYVWFVLTTSRIHHAIPPTTAPYIDAAQPALFLLWHSRMLLFPALINKKLQLHAMVSHHSDGRLIGDVLEGFGIGVVHGSTSRGGAHALRQLITLYKQGRSIVLTPDGPRGPREVVSEGTAQLALLTNAPVICLNYSVKRSITLRSWDRFIIPLPFNRIYFTYGEPLFPASVENLPKSEQREVLRCAIEKRLHSIGIEAQHNFNAEKTE